MSLFLILGVSEESKKMKRENEKRKMERSFPLGKTPFVEYLEQFIPKRGNDDYLTAFTAM